MRRSARKGWQVTGEWHFMVPQTPLNVDLGAQELRVRLEIT